MKNVFCKAPWVSLQYGSLLMHGGVTPCCEWTGAAFKGSLNEYMSGEWLANVKNIMSDTSVTSHREYVNRSCENCINLDNLGITSKRQQLQEFEIHDGIQLVDYRPDNICNLKCRMCFPGNSSMIAKEQNHSFEILDTSDIYQFDFSTVTSLSIVGGEPSISKEVDTFLQWLIDNGRAEYIVLKVTTNATNANANWIDKLKKFPKCHTVISLDGTNEIYEYIRTNANWDSIVKNIKSYEFENNVITYQITGSMYNMPVIERWIDWFADKDNVTLYPVEGRKSLMLSALPDNIRFEKMKFLESIDNNLARDAYTILNDTRFNRNHLDWFIEYTHALDNLRNTDITKLDPVFKKIMEII